MHTIHAPQQRLSNPSNRSRSLSQILAPGSPTPILEIPPKSKNDISIKLDLKSFRYKNDAVNFNKIAYLNQNTSKPYFKSHRQSSSSLFDCTTIMRPSQDVKNESTYQITQTQQPTTRIEPKAHQNKICSDLIRKLSRKPSIEASISKKDCGSSRRDSVSTNSAYFFDEKQTFKTNLHRRSTSHILSQSSVSSSLGSIPNTESFLPKVTGIQKSQPSSLSTLSSLEEETKNKPSRLGSKVCKEIREINASILYSEDGGSRRNAELIRKSKAIEYKNFGINFSSSRRNSISEKALKNHGLDVPTVDEEAEILDAITKTARKEFDGRLQFHKRYYNELLTSPRYKFGYSKDTSLHEKLENLGFSSKTPASLNSLTALDENDKNASSNFSQPVRSRVLPESISEIDVAQKEAIDSILSEREKFYSEKNRILEKAKQFGNQRIRLFHRMVREKNLNGMDSMLVEDPSLINKCDEVLETPLHWAVKLGSKDVVEFLCRFNPDFQATDLVGRTPLKLANLFGHNHLIKLLENEEQYALQKKDYVKKISQL